MSRSFICPRSGAPCEKGTCLATRCVDDIREAEKAAANEYKLELRRDGNAVVELVRGSAGPETEKRAFDALLRAMNEQSN